jgi:ComF family protein
MYRMPQTDFHLNDENSLRQRITGRIDVRYALGLFKFSKSGSIQHLLHALKYKNQPDIGVMLGKVYAQKLKEASKPFGFDLIVPVPLHVSRLRKRGYNQSSKFAEGLSEILNVPHCETLLFRKAKTGTQTRKSKLNRWENMKDVFSCSEKQLPGSTHILLVDDVITTGATIEACVVALQDHGFKKISIACIAVA